MAVANIAPDGDGLTMKAEALLRRQRERREAEVRREQRAADAARVRAAGCLCFLLTELGSFDGELKGSRARPAVVRHDRRCPIALAAILEGK